MNKKSLNRKAALALFITLFFLLMVRNCACGAVYYPQLDDYIQYHNYLQTPTFQALQQRVGLLASRPLAGLLDYFFWGRMFDHMILGVALISLLYVVAAWLLWDGLKRYFRLSPLFPVLVTLLPLGMEGTYWMSASTRTVVGIFFAALAFRGFQQWLDRGGGGRLALYMAFQLLPFGFYEQAGVLSVTLTVGAAILEWRLNKKNPKRCAVSLWGIPAMGLYFWGTRLLSSGGVYSSRMELVLPFNRYYWTSFLPEILGQFRDAFLKGGLLTTVKGFLRGMGMIFSEGMWGWALGAAALCVLLGLLGRRLEGEEAERHPLWLPLLCGALLAIGPVSLFLVLSNPWFSLRGTVTSFPGIALAADSLLLWLWDKLAGRRQQGGMAALAAILAFVFCAAGTSEIKDYRDTWAADQQVAALVIDTLLADGLDRNTGRVGILNLEASYLSDQNFFYHEHIHGCTESEWAFSGLLNASGVEGLPAVTPLPANPLYRQWNREANHPGHFAALYWFDGTSMRRAVLEEVDENTYQIQDRQGQVLGHIWEEDGTGYIRSGS